MVQKAVSKYGEMLSCSGFQNYYPEYLCLTIMKTEYTKSVWRKIEAGWGSYVVRFYCSLLLF